VTATISDVVHDRPQAVALEAGGGAVTATTPVRDPEIDDQDLTDETWKVVVWNDPVNLIDYVAYVLRKLFGYSEQKAMELTMRVHTTGRAIVKDGPREQAEMDCYRLHHHGLWATLER